jgi:hypothetical protein
MPGLKRVLATLAISSAVLWLGLAPALAAPNPNSGRVLLSPGSDLTGPFCGTATGDILAHVAVDREYVKVFISADGTERDMVEGYQQDQFTVVATGKTVFVNASGPGTITFHPDGTIDFVLQGHTVWLNPPDGGLWLLHGLVHWDLTTGMPATTSGTITDICALLR